MFPENTCIPQGGLWKFQAGGGDQNSIFLKDSMNQNWNFQGGEGFIPREIPWWEG